MQSKAKVLVLDVETSPLIVYSWGIRDQNIGLSQIKEDSYIMAWTAKWLGESKLIYRDQRHAKDMSDDKAILLDLWKLLDEADVVITQNGAAFDEPRVKARMMLHGMKPYSPVQHHDTYQQLKGIGFTSHKLEYLTGKFCKKYKKLSHKAFPGMSLWHECLKGNIKAWNEMQKYNNYDVLSTEELYLNTRGWSGKKAPKLFYNDDARLCKFCGEYKLTQRGYDRTVKKTYHRLQCQACGKWTRGEEAKLHV